LYGYDNAGQPVYVLGTRGSASGSGSKASEEPVEEVTVHGKRPKRPKESKQQKNKEGGQGPGLAAGSVRSTADSVRRIEYEKAIKQEAKEAVKAIQDLRESDAPGDSVKAWDRAQDASKLREIERQATREKMSAPGRTLSEAIDKTQPSKFYADKYTSPPEIRPNIGKGVPPKLPDPQGSYVYEAAEDIAEAAGKSRGGIPGALLNSGRYLGPAGIVLGIVLSAREIYNAPEWEKGRVAAHEAGSFGGSLLGAEIGGELALGAAALILL
jgi:hypothetical protein